MKIFNSLKTRWIIWVWKHTPTCAQMSRLASRSLDEPLSFRLRLQMKLHNLICAWCRRYAQQLRFLHEGAPHFNKNAWSLATRGLSAEAKERIKQHLRHAI